MLQCVRVSVLLAIAMVAASVQVEAYPDRSATYVVSTPTGNATVSYQASYGGRLQVIGIARPGQPTHVFIRDWSVCKVKVSIGAVSLVTCQILPNDVILQHASGIYHRSDISAAPGVFESFVATPVREAVEQDIAILRTLSPHHLSEAGFFVDIFALAQNDPSRSMVSTTGFGVVSASAIFVFQDGSDPDTLAGCLKVCKENYNDSIEDLEAPNDPEAVIRLSELQERCRSACYDRYASNGVPIPIPPPQF